VAASLREFGFRQPIVVDDEGVIGLRAHALEGGAAARPGAGACARGQEPHAGAAQGLPHR
jgi:hypothetical protein